MRLTYMENAGGFLGIGTALPPEIRMALFTIAPAVILLALTVLVIHFRLTLWNTVDLTLFIAGGASNLLLMAAFGLILLIACANVANLLLARGSARSHEIGIRLSLGASRARVARQVLIESMLISIAGGIAGAMLAVWSFQALVALALPALLPAGAPPVNLDLSPDLRLAWFAAAVTIGKGLLFGSAPALHVSKQDLHAVVKPGTAGAGGSSRGGRLQGTLIGVQVALCMALMIAAGLLLRGLLATHTIDLGFHYRDVITVSLALPNSAYTPEELGSVRRRLMHEVEALPGVDAVAYAGLAPLGNDEFFTVPIRLPGQNQDAFLPARLNGVTPAYSLCSAFRWYSLQHAPTRPRLCTANKRCETSIVIFGERECRRMRAISARG